MTNFFSPAGGVGNYVMRLAKAFTREGIEVIVIHDDAAAVKEPSDLLRQHRVQNFSVFEPEDSREKIKAVMEILGREKPDLVHVQANTHFELETEILKNFPAVKSTHVYDFCPSGNKFHLASGKICRHSTGPMCIPRMVYKRCTSSWRPSTISMFYRRTEKNNRSDAAYPKIIAASQYVREEAIASGYSAEQVEVIPYFADEVAEFLAKITGERIVMFTGRVVPEKGLNHLLKAMALLPPDLKWRLAVDGDGPVLNEMKRLAVKLGIGLKVDFLGWLAPEEHRRLYQKAAVVAVPSLWPEPFGLVGIEAMSYGKPVVAFRVGGIPEWLEDQKTGFLIEPYDLEVFAARLGKLICEPSLCEKLGREGRAQVLKKFSAEQHLKKLIAVYESILARRRGKF